MTAVPDDDDDELDTGILRPFIVTRGRTKAAAGVVMESLVDRGDAALDGEVRIESHHAQILDLLETTLSAAEISALADLPLGVVLVLISDMSELGLVEVHATADLDDIHLVRKLIDGVRSL